MAEWAELPMDQELYANVDETLLSNRNAAMENVYMNPANGQSRFPGRKAFVDGLSGQRTYLHEHRGDLIAATDQGDVYRIDKAGGVQDVTGVKIGGGRRVIFDRTEEELVMAAGSKIIRLASSRSQVLSEAAPESTHVAFIDGYIIAIEPYSGRFYHCQPGQYRQWDPLDVFTAEGKPDDLNACVVTPYRELLLCGVDSIEQFERQSSANLPFARRWATGEGLYAPYTLVASDNGTYGINKLREFVRFRQQVSQPQSDEVDLVLEKIDVEAPEDVPDAWLDAWAEQINIKGQKFIVLQIPNATNPYGTQGITALYDYRFRRWSNLYDWDDDAGVPVRWAPWSYYPMWGRHFVGIAGGVQELSINAYDHAGAVQRVLVRSGHVDKFGPSRFDNVRLRLKRGTTGSNAARDAQVAVRANKDNLGFGPWAYEPLGRAGDRKMVIEFGSFGEATTWQFEIAVTDAVPVEIVGIEALVSRLRW